MKLIYCAYSLLDQEKEPDWVDKLANNRFVKREGWALYRPALGFMENAERIETLAALNRAAHVDQARRDALKLDPALFEGLATLRDRMVRADQGPFLDVSFKRLYALLRSDVVVADMNVPDHGDKADEIVYAYLIGVPVIGVAHRFILPPAILGKVSSVLFPTTSDEIVRQILAFDHKTTAALEHYRRDPPDAKLTELAERMKKMAEQRDAQPPEEGNAEQPDGRDESTD